MKHLLRKKGFTIIEVSLVLAIAGIILTMAFIALPALQRQSRDAQRKTDASKFITALKEYQRNNRGALPKQTFDASLNIDKTNTVDINGYFNTWLTEGIDAKPWPKFYNDYLGSDFTNPDGKKYSFIIENSNGYYDYDTYISTESFEDRWADWYVFIGSTCKEGKPEPSNNSRNLAVIVKLETNDTYCINN